MPKLIHGFRLSTPDAPGYPDRVQVLNSDTGDMVVYESNRFRTNPDSFQPAKDSPTGQQRTWQEAYTRIAPTGADGIPWICTTTKKHGVCIQLNPQPDSTGGPVPVMEPDPNNHGLMYALDVEIHCGFSPGWPGSKACQTVHPGDWQTFLGHFFLGDKGIFILTDETDTGEDTLIVNPSDLDKP